MAWLGQCAGFTSIVLSALPFFGFIFGSSWLFIVIVQDITKDVATFNSAVDALNVNSDCAELTGRLFDIIQSYSDAKQLRLSFSLNFVLRCHPFNLCVAPLGV